MGYENIYNNLVFRAEIKEILENDGSKIQKVRATGYQGEEMKLLRPQTHGYSSRPPAGSIATGISINGRRDLGLLIGGEMPGKRINGDGGDGSATLYDDQGNYIVLNGSTVKIFTNGGTIEIDVGGGKIKVTANTSIELNAPAVDLGGTGGKRIRLEDGSLTTKTKAL